MHYQYIVVPFIYSSMGAGCDICILIKINDDLRDWI